MVESVIAELAVGLEQAFAHGDDPITEWIHAMFGAIAKRKRLFTVLPSGAAVAGISMTFRIAG